MTRISSSVHRQGSISMMVFTLVLCTVSLMACSKDGGTKPSPAGACCTSAGVCSLTTQAQCANGTWHADWTTCDPNPCPPPTAIGACCTAAGLCSLTTQAQCSSGTWHGEWASCTPNPCPPPTAIGACCTAAGLCSLTTQAQCSIGTWHGEWASCTPNPCPPPTAVGACCTAAGLCSLTTQAQCSNGTWHAEWTSCSPNPCPPPTGACCVPATGACSVTSQLACTAPGIWKGVGVPCDAATCEQPLAPAACCAPAGTCTVTMQAACIAPNTWGAAAECDPNPCPQPLPAPTFDPIAGTYYQPLQVAIRCAVDGADNRYTTNGSDPTLSSDLYLNVIVVDRPTTLKAKAYKADRMPSPTASATYAFTCADPQFSPPSGTYNSARNVGIADTTRGVTIYYTTDGSAPTASSPVYVDSIEVALTTTVKAIAMRTDWTNSAVVTATYTIVLTLPEPTFDPPGGDYHSPQQVALACSIVGADIRYTTNGSEPTSASTLYSGVIDVNTLTTIRAKAFKTGWTSGTTSSATYSFTCGDLQLTPAGGTYGTPQSVTIVCASPGVTIHYTTDGSTPTASSDSLLPIVVASTTTLKAIALRTGWTSSQIATAVYTMQQVPTPSLTPPGDHYDLPQQVTIGCSMPEAVIYYTLNGSEPTTGSTRYIDPVEIAANKTLRARAFRSGWQPSEIATGEYIIGLFYDFEGWNGNFFSQSGWQCGTPSQVTPHSGTGAWAMTLSGSYAGSAPYVLISPAWSLTENAQLSFWHCFYLTWNYWCQDHGYLYISADHGVTWAQMTSSQGSGDFAGTQNAWGYASYDLGAYAGQTVVVKFTLSAASCGGGSGWFIDDLQVTNAAEVKKRGAGQ